jgi:hypothetical protein
MKSTEIIATYASREDWRGGKANRFEIRRYEDGKLKSTETATDEKVRSLGCLNWEEVDDSAMMPYSVARLERHWTPERRIEVASRITVKLQATVRNWSGGSSLLDRIEKIDKLSESLCFVLSKPDRFLESNRQNIAEFLG